MRWSVASSWQSAFVDARGPAVRLRGRSQRLRGPRDRNGAGVLLKLRLDMLPLLQDIVPPRQQLSAELLALRFVYERPLVAWPVLAVVCHADGPFNPPVTTGQGRFPILQSCAKVQLIAFARCRNRTDRVPGSW